MATKYLVKGATAFDAAAWGGSAMTAADDFIIEDMFQTIVGSDLDQSAIVGGFESMQITQGASGTIGGGSAGPFIADFDNSADAYISNRGAVTMHYQAGGDSSLCQNYDCGAGSFNYIYGGKIATVTMDGGTFEANASTDIETAMYQSGGSSRLWYNANDLALFEQTGGTSLLERMPTAASVFAGSAVLDINDDQTMSGTSLTVKGSANVQLVAGAIPTINVGGGILDLSKARRPLDLSGSTITVSGGRIIENPIVTLPTITYVGALKRNVGGAVPLD